MALGERVCFDSLCLVNTGQPKGMYDVAARIPTTSSPDGTALSDIRVLDLGGPVAAYCAKLLAELGADTIRVEPPQGDDVRSMPPFYHETPGPRASLPFLYMNTSKRSVTLNLDTADGQDILKELVKTADVVVESADPDYLARRQIDYPDLARLNPGLIMTSITPFGRTGPYRHYEGDPLVVLALSGVTYLSGWPDRAPVGIEPSQAYYISGMHSATGTLIALQHRDLAGEGQHVDVSMQQCMSLGHEWTVMMYDLMGEIRPRFGLNYIGGLRRCYPCKDGFVLCVVTPLRWDPFVDWLQSEGLASPGLEQLVPKTNEDLIQRRDPIEGALEAMVRDRTMQEVFGEARKRGLWFTPINTPAEVLEDPQLQARGFFVEPQDGHLDGPLPYPGAPYKLSKTPWRMTHSAPWPGEHNAEVYKGELGLTEEQLSTLAYQGVI